MAKNERRLAAIMFTDMVGYTALGQRDESLSLALVETQRKVLEPVLARHGGRVVKTMGDAFLVEFTSALEAARCAYEVQRSVREFNMALSIENRIHLRIGIHLGDVVEREGDIFGDAVNIASRIEPLAEEGGVCLTQQVYDQVRNKLNIQLESNGKTGLKNVSEAVEVYRMVMPWNEPEVTMPVLLDKNRIVVLPFASMGPDLDDEYFADGLTEELISELSQVGGLEVIARTSAMNYKKKEKSISQIGKELNVGTAVEGSVRKAGKKIRVTAQLINANTEGHLWSSSYDRELEDIFAIQSDIASKIVEALRMRFGPNHSPAGKRPENIEAYTLWLKGQFQWNKMNEEGIMGSLGLFKEAIEVDPSYARGYAGLADAYHAAVDFGFMDKVDGLLKSMEAATKSLELDDGLAEAHAALGDIMFHTMRYEEALRENRRAIELDPSCASAHQRYSLCLDNMGRPKDALDEIEKAHELDPLSPLISLTVGLMNMDNKRLDEAIAVFDKMVESEPTNAEPYWGRALCFMSRRMKEEAYSNWEAYQRLTRNEQDWKVKLAFLYGWFGERERALTLINELIRKGGTHGMWGSWESWIAACYAVLGDPEEFFRWIDKSLSEKGMIWLGSLRFSPFYDKVRADPRFPEIFKKLGIPYQASSAN